MIDSFYLASIPRPPKVLGLQLRPFALGHIILLNFVESAFVCSGVPDYNDLALSVLLCASTYKEGVSHLDNPDTPESMKYWADRLTGADRMFVRLGWRKPKAIDLVAEVTTFTEYLTEGSKIRKYQFNPQDFKEMDCPQCQIVKLTLMRDLHLPESELMDRPWSLCLEDYVALKAIKGEVKLYNEDDMAEARATAELLAEKIRKGEIKCPS